MPILNQQTNNKAEKNSIPGRARSRAHVLHQFTFDEYLQVLSQRRKERESKKSHAWHKYNSFDHHDPHGVQLHVVYDMLRHVMWKLSTNLHDVDQMAYFEIAWDAAADEAEANYWRLGKSEKVDDDADEYILKLERKNKKQS